MININLLNPKSQTQAQPLSSPPTVDSAAPTATAAPETPIASEVPSEAAASPGLLSLSTWHGMVIINLIVIAVLIALIMFLPANTPLIGGFIGPAKIALSRFINLIF